MFSVNDWARGPIRWKQRRERERERMLTQHRFKHRTRSLASFGTKPGIGILDRPARPLSLSRLFDRYLSFLVFSLVFFLTKFLPIVCSLIVRIFNDRYPLRRFSDLLSTIHRTRSIPQNTPLLYLFDAIIKEKSFMKKGWLFHFMLHFLVNFIHRIVVRKVLLLFIIFRFLIS